MNLISEIWMGLCYAILVLIVVLSGIALFMVFILAILCVIIFRFSCVGLESIAGPQSVWAEFNRMEP